MHQAAARHVQRPAFPGDGSERFVCSNGRAVRALCGCGWQAIGFKTIWLYTGYTYEELIEMNTPIVNSILNEIDILVDGPFVQGLKSPDKHWVGSSNQRVIDMKKTLEINQVVLHNTSK